MLRPGNKSMLALLVALLLAVPAAAQEAASQPIGAVQIGPPASINSIRVVQEHGVPALEILASRPVVPEIHSFDSPPHLVINLPNARMAIEQKPVFAGTDNIIGIREEQSPTTPPMAFIVLDLKEPYGYSWDAAGNRLMIRLKPSAESAAKQPPPVVSAAPPATNAAPSVVPVASEPNVPTGNILRAGSSVAAGAETAILHLSRGGEVHVCPGTSISVMPSPNRRDLMLGLNTGSLETHYTLETAAHSIVTPDFRILFAGPGVFHFAVSTDSHGDTCVRALKGNSSSALVTELMGERFYQVKPDEQAVFRGGQIDQVDTHVPLECGCPPPPRRVLTAADNPPPAVTDVELSAKAHVIHNPMAVIKPPASISPGDAGLQARLSTGPETAPLPPPQPNDVHARVSAPFVFSAGNSSSVPPPPDQIARELPLQDNSAQRQVSLDAVVTPPPPRKKVEHHGFFGRLKGVFGALFH